MAAISTGGKVYGIPMNAEGVLVIDTANGTSHKIGSWEGKRKWTCGVLCDNGKICCLPYTGRQVLMIDTHCDTATTVGTPFDGGRRRVRCRKLPVVDTQ